MARRKSSDEETSYWLSYSDMMAGLLLVFVLITTFSMMQARKQYEQKEKELQEQSEKIQEAQELIEEQQYQLDKIIGVRSNLVEALKQEFEGTDLRVSVDSKTGAITFDSSVLFDYNKYDIKQTGKEFLEEFLPRYFGILLEENFKDYVSEIIIEGHTDTEGDYIYNLKLSQERALSVATFCLDSKNSFIEEVEIENLRNIITANGRSFSDPVYGNDGKVDMASSRRVEFKFRLKDEEMIAEMSEILNQ